MVLTDAIMLIRGLANKVVDPEMPGQFNQAVMVYLCLQKLTRRSSVLQSVSRKIPIASRVLSQEIVSRMRN